MDRSSHYYDSIPLAQPYIWGPSGDIIASIDTRKRKGGGVQYLEAKLRKRELGRRANEILRELLLANVDVFDEEEEGVNVSGVGVAKHEDLAFVETNHNTTDIVNEIPKPVDTSLPDEEVVKLAQAGKVSLFSSLLKVIEESSTPVSTKQLIRACCLCVAPESVPSNMDAKEVTLGALYFLCQENENDNLNLPLIQTTVKCDDLEKRSFEKVGSWSLHDEDFLSRLKWLEGQFQSSSGSWKDLARGRFCPTLVSTADVRALFLKGTIPPSATGKATRKGGGGGKRKQASSSPVPTETMDLSGEPFH